MRGKGPIDYSTISVNEMIRDKLGYVEGYDWTVDDYPVASNEMLLK